MVGFFSDLSDTDDSAIDEIISQAKDASVLEQVSAINCSSFTDSLLPTDLESRFRKLKSFPAATNPPPPPPGDSKGDNFPAFKPTSSHHPAKKGHEESPVFSPSDGKTGSDPKLQRGFVSSSPSDSADSSRGKKGLKSKSKLGSASPASASGSEESSLSSMFKPAQKGDEPKVKSGSASSSPSPPRRAGCFWCSPQKKDSRRRNKSKENWGVLGLDSDDEFLSDLGSFSIKEQQKILKMAMKEERKISREAEKIVEMAKQASARINITGIEDELSDEED